MNLANKSDNKFNSFGINFLASNLVKVSRYQILTNAITSIATVLTPRQAVCTSTKPLFKISQG